MSEPFIGEITIFAGNFAPRGWAFCDGQLLNIVKNTALFSLFGTMYGGDGRTTFGLPGLRGRIPIGARQGPGLSPRRESQKAGTQSNTLSVAQMPAHSHNVRASKEVADADVPTGNVLAAGELYRNADPEVDMRAGTTTNTGGGQPVNNVMPSLVVNFIVALVGLYPSRS